MNLPQHYLRTRVESSTPGELVVMLYDGLLRFTRAAAEQLALRTVADDAVAAHAIARATNILTALNSALNFSVDPAFCERMSQLYEFFAQRLSEARSQRDPKLALEIIPLIETLRDAWSQSLVNLRGAAPQPAAVA